MSASGAVRLRVVLDTMPEPEAREFDRCDLQYTRRWIIRGLAECERITDTKARAVVQRALLVAASELGCMVCGQAIAFEHLYDSPMVRRTLVHLYGNCADILANRLGMTVDEVMRGEAL